MWDTNELDFKKREKEKKFNNDSYFNLYTDNELLSLISFSKTDGKISSFLKLVELKGGINVDTVYHKDIIEHLITLGCISLKRSKDILNV